MLKVAIIALKGQDDGFAASLVAGRDDNGDKRLRRLWRCDTSANDGHAEPKRDYDIEHRQPHDD